MTGDTTPAPDPLEDTLLVDATLNRTVVAVDGPAGSGKSSVSRAAASPSASTTRTRAPRTARSAGSRWRAASTRRIPPPSRA